MEVLLAQAFFSSSTSGKRKRGIGGGGTAQGAQGAQKKRAHHTQWSKKMSAEATGGNSYPKTCRLQSYELAGGKGRRDL